MIKNYFTAALRNLNRNKVFSIINISGLAIGISASLVIFLIVQYDFSFDKHHQGGDRIYRVVSNFIFSDETYKNSGVTFPMGNALRNEGTGIELVVPFMTMDGDIKVSIPAEGKEQPIVMKKQKKFVAADETYFRLFQHEWVAGSPQSSLRNPYAVVLTESRARLYFPELKLAETLGKEFYMNDSVRLTVTGIIKDLPYKSDFNFQAFLSRATLETTSLKPDDWDNWSNTNGSSQLMLKLNPGTTVSQVTKQLETIYNKNNKREPGDNSKTFLLLQPLGDIHFNTDYGTFDDRVAHKPTLYGLLAVAAFLLLLGGINFINLTTAQAAKRAKEIGIRKTIGSSRTQLVWQYLGETFFITLIATVFSIVITPLLLKIFADFIPADLSFNLLKQPSLWLFLIIIMVLVTLLSGFYPALVLSRLNPVLVLKNQTAVNSGQSRSAWMRKSLTVAQFVIAQVFIIASFFVSKQIHFTLQKDLGFNKEAILYFSTNYYDTVKSHRKLLMEKLKAIPEISMVSLSTNPPSSHSMWSGTVKYIEGKKEIEADVQFKYGDTNYLKLYKMTLLAGTGLQHSDTVNQFVINETYARKLGFNDPQQAIGKLLQWDIKQVPVSGVVKDFHTQSLHEEIKPTAIGMWANVCRTFNIALLPQQKNGNNWKAAIGKIEKAWKEVYPDEDFEYQFLDESIEKFHTSEKNISRLLNWATGLAIFISCLGLLGLVIFVTNQRTKEIGIRKVIGASVTQIVALLSKDFIKLVTIAFVIAVPVAWWGIYKWLENFAFKTDISWWIFLISGVVMIIFALATLCLQTFRSAMANPVNSLRSE